MDKLIADMKAKMKDRIERVERELARIRAGRATPALLDGIRVDYYGSKVPINQVATIAVPEPRYLTITPWDKQALSAVKKAIMTSDLGLNPSDDGNIIRIEIPPPSEEGRIELAKRADRVGEDAKIAIRNLRRETIERIKAMEKQDGLSEDEVHAGEKEVQKITEEMIAMIDKHVETKRKEIMEL
ncbi:MAG: ribosome recycling factor [Candidatus Zipacnadales bacterium]